MKSWLAYYDDAMTSDEAERMMELERAAAARSAKEDGEGAMLGGDEYDETLEVEQMAIDRTDAEHAALHPDSGGWESTTLYLLLCGFSCVGSISLGFVSPCVCLSLCVSLYVSLFISLDLYHLHSRSSLFLPFSTTCSHTRCS